MDRIRTSNGRISKNKRCSPCMCCIKKRIETCKITTPVDKLELITNDDKYHDDCKNHESKVINDN